MSEWRQSEVDRVAHVYIGALDEPGFRLRACDSNLVVPGRLTKPRVRRRCKRCSCLSGQRNDAQSRVAAARSIFEQFERSEIYDTDALVALRDLFGRESSSDGSAT